MPLLLRRLLMLTTLTSLSTLAPMPLNDLLLLLGYLTIVLLSIHIIGTLEELVIINLVQFYFR